MCHVYQNSCLTIAALGAKDTSQGCFAKRNPLFYDPCFLYHDENGSHWYFEPQASDILLKSSFRNQTMCERGWTFQKRIISPRVLYFGELVVFECLEGMVADIEPIAKIQTDDFYRMKLDFLQQPRVSKINEESRREIIANVPKLWKNILVNYTDGS